MRTALPVVRVKLVVIVVLSVVPRGPARTTVGRRLRSVRSSPEATSLPTPGCANAVTPGRQEARKLVVSRES